MCICIEHHTRAHDQPHVLSWTAKATRTPLLRILEPKTQGWQSLDEISGGPPGSFLVIYIGGRAEAKGTHSAQEVLTFWVVPALAPHGSTKCIILSSRNGLAALSKLTLVDPTWFKEVPGSLVRQKYAFR